MLRTPATDERAQVHGAAAALGQAVGVIERSYAANDLAPHDGHLALPTSARYCTHLRVALPDTGRARLRCQLRPLEGAGGTLTLQRSPAGAWHCSAVGVEEALLPAHCRH
ncbi:pilin [Stenotrophomonas sp. ESTM1D_MKCIP4_1]|uniref:pilin n=1 Tax=Stenotrophomonas sp. ESTM1D_MKCIP4_1 TaxID=2072414 RepID=UPI00131F08E2|nr:pilin [Stenotrophomonas sp. ESTM1D_MKCIP4_1]